MKKIKKIISDSTLEQLEECIKEGVTQEICGDGWTVKYYINVGGKEIKYKTLDGAHNAYELIKSCMRDKRIEFLLEK